MATASHGSAPSRSAPEDRPPPARSLDALARAAATCEACELHRTGTQTVFGAGPRSARLMLVGEQPGDREDLAGEPFVGPAGRLLDDALAASGIDRHDAYVTNAVKHFRWKQTRGARRIHQNPNLEHVRACRPWLEAELRLVQPAIVVCLGATAAKALLGPKFRVTQERGRVVRTTEPFVVEVPPLLATVHPSSILRLRGDRAAFDEAFDAFVQDLRVAAREGKPAAGT